MNVQKKMIEEASFIKRVAQHVTILYDKRFAELLACINSDDVAKSHLNLNLYTFIYRKSAGMQQCAIRLLLNQCAQDFYGKIKEGQIDRLKVHIEELASDRYHYPHINSEDFWPTPIDEAVKAQQTIKYKENHILAVILLNMKKYVHTSEMDKCFAFAEYGLKRGEHQASHNHEVAAKIAECCEDIVLISFYEFAGCFERALDKNAQIYYEEGSRLPQFMNFAAHYRPDHVKSATPYGKWSDRLENLITENKEALKEHAE